MDVKQMTVSEFLLARIAEDETDARFGQEHSYDARYDVGGFDPARVLRECEAKRRIVANYDAAQQARDGYDVTDPGRWITAQTVVMALWPAVAALATIYVDHRDYRPEWRP